MSCLNHTFSSLYDDIAATHRVVVILAVAALFSGLFDCKIQLNSGSHWFIMVHVANDFCETLALKAGFYGYKIDWRTRHYY